MKVCVTGAGGFIGSYLCERLRAEGHYVVGADIRYPELAPTGANEFKKADLRFYRAMCDAFAGCEMAFALAADMGGMGYIGNPQNDAQVMHTNALLNLNAAEAARNCGVETLFFSSSACVYPDRTAGNAALCEADAWPARPDNRYGLEKLFSEELYWAYAQCHRLNVFIGRFHNCYGPFGMWSGDRAKAPAALCRKVAEARRDGRDFIKIWGDGSALRSYTYVDDLVEGVMRLVQSDYHQPLNIGSGEMVSVNKLARTIMEAAGVDLEIRHEEGPVGVAARNSDNARCRQVLDWEPATPLREGIAHLYPWVEAQVLKQKG